MAHSGFYGISTAGNNGVECRVYVDITDDAANNRSTIDAELQFRKSNGFASQGNTFGTFTINGSGITISGNKSLPSNGAWVSFGVAGRRTINHGADGRAPLTTVSVNGVGMSSSSDFDTPVNGTLTFDSTNGFADYNRLPSAPGTPVVTEGTLTPVAMTWTWAAPGSVGAGILEYEFRYSKSSTFASGVTTVSTGTARSYAMAGLDPGNPYYVGARARTADGWGPWSTTASQATLPSTPPGLGVASSPSGTTAILTFSPPGGVSGVSKYSYERRTTGTAAPVTAGETTVTTATVTDLVPGNSYDWRASAWISGYQSPWSDWMTVVQAKPNTSPGDYFDGDTPDKTDLDYSWTGAANLSTSIATGRVPTGWMVFANGNPTPGATGVVYQVTDNAVPPVGAAGAHAAQVVFFSDQTVPGFSLGTDVVGGTKAEVTEGATYVASIWVKTSKDTRGQANIGWLPAVGSVPFGAVGGVQAQTVAGQWQRFTVTAVAPAGAAFAQVAWIHTLGTGYSAFVGGDSVTADAAMISLGEDFGYFDGDTPDTAQYTYDWTGTANSSTSIRETVDTAVTSSLIDPDCPPVPAPPRPPTVPDICIDNIGVWRRYYATIPSQEVSDWLSVVPTVEILTGSVPARQVRIRVYPNPFGYASGQINTDEWCSEQIVSYVPPSTIFTLDGVTQRAWAEVGGGAAQNADHLLHGSNGTPATWPVLSCGIPYLISLEVPVDAPAGNIEIRAALTRRA